MAAVDVKADLPMSPQAMWEHVSDLSELGEWRHAQSKGTSRNR
jgi:hypothetical protein